MNIVLTGTRRRVRAMKKKKKNMYVNLAKMFSDMSISHIKNLPQNIALTLGDRCKFEINVSE